VGGDKARQSKISRRSNCKAEIWNLEVDALVFYFDLLLFTEKERGNKLGEKAGRQKIGRN
jgi:hypothetical protein